MNRRTLLRGICATLVTFALTIADAQAQTILVQGIITNAQGKPLPGITVSLFHPELGRSYPAYTDGWGRYALYNIPPRPSPYYIEAYWGNTLVYRSPLPVRGPTQWNIRLR